MRRVLPVGAAVLAATVCLTSQLDAQGVLIAPQAVVVNGSGDASIVIINPADTRVEIAVSTLFGYPVTDDSGNLRLQTFDTVADSMPSAASWISAYPRRFTLEAGQRQTVRLVVAAPTNTKTGEYWARLVISSKNALPSQSVPVADSTQPVSMRFDLEVRSILPLLYRRGDVATRVSIGEVEADQKNDSLHVRPNLRRGGNAAWVGTLRMSLRDAGNTEVRRSELPLAVYYALSPRFALPVEGLPSGTYTLEINALATRADLPRHQVLSATPQVYRTQVRLP